MLRLLHLMVLALTCLTLAVSPVVAKAMSDQAVCARVMEVVAAPDGPHGHAAHAAATPEDDGAGAGEAAIVCCDDGCLLDGAMAAAPTLREGRMSRARNQWDASDLAEMIGPFGLRRPPRG